MGVWLSVAAVTYVDSGRLCLAQDGQIGPLPLSTRGPPVVGFPEGAAATAPVPPAFTQADTTTLRNGRYRAAIAMQALDTPWNSLQIQGIAATLGRYGVEVVAVTDAGQDPQQ